MTSTLQTHDELETGVGQTLDELRHLLDEQRSALTEQTHMLRALDARREELEELIVDMLPVGNAAMLMLTRALDAADQSSARAWATSALRDMEAARTAPPPRLLDLLRLMRTPDVRRGMAIALAALGVVGRGAPTLTTTT